MYIQTKFNSSFDYFLCITFSIRIGKNRRILELKDEQLDKKKQQDGDQLLT
jgi:hypothetical protein